MIKNILPAQNLWMLYRVSNINTTVPGIWNITVGCNTWIVH